MAKARKYDHVFDHYCVSLAMEALPPPTNKLPTKKTQLGEFVVEGLYVESALKCGLRVMDEARPETGLTEFPRRPNGTPLCMAQPFIEALISKQQKMKESDATQLSTAQGDLKHLSVRQLLRLRVNNLDYTPKGEGRNAASGEGLLFKLDMMLFLELGRSVVKDLMDKLPALQDADLHLLGRQAVLISAASLTVTADTTWWVLWCVGQLIYFDAKEFKGSLEFPASGALDIRDDTYSDPVSKGVHWMLRWQVTQVGSASMIRAPQRQPSKDKDRDAAAAVGANTRGPKVTLAYIERALRYLKSRTEVEL